MLRRRLKTADLRIEEYTIGQRTGTGIALVYLKGLASEQVLTEIRHAAERHQYRRHSGEQLY